MYLLIVIRVGNYNRVGGNKKVTMFFKNFLTPYKAIAAFYCTK
jgi:hypothetical protein